MSARQSRAAVVTAGEAAHSRNTASAACTSANAFAAVCLAGALCRATCLAHDEVPWMQTTSPGKQQGCYQISGAATGRLQRK